MPTSRPMWTRSAARKRYMYIYISLSLSLPFGKQFLILERDVESSVKSSKALVKSAKSAAEEKWRERPRTRSARPTSSECFGTNYCCRPVQCISRFEAHLTYWVSFFEVSSPCESMFTGRGVNLISMEVCLSWHKYPEMEVCNSFYKY